MTQGKALAEDQPVRSVDRSPSRPILLTATILALISGSIYFSLRDRGLMMTDEGALFMGASRIVDGQVPYRDFHHFYGPGRFYLLAGLFELFDRSVLVMRSMLAAMRVLTVVLTFLVGARLVPIAYALVPAGVVLLIPGPWFKTFTPLAGLLSMWLTLRYLEKPGRHRAALCGLVTGTMILFRQDAGLLGLALALLAVAAAPAGDGGGLRRGERLVRLERLALLGLAALAPLAGAALLLARAEALAPAVEQMFLLAPAYTASRWDSVFQMMKDCWPGDPVRIFLFLAPIPLGLAATVLWARRSVRREDGTSRLELLLITAAALATLVPAYLPAGMIRLYQGWHFLWILTAILLRQAVLRIGGRTSRAWGIAAAACAFALPALIVVDLVRVERPKLASTEYSGMPTALARCREPLVVRGETLYVSPRKAHLVRRLVRYVQANTAEGEPILVLPNQSMLYRFCDRPNPTRFIATYTQRYDPSIQDQALWRQMVDEADRSKVRLVVVKKSFLRKSNPHTMREYLLEHFGRVAEFGKIVVMVRNGAERRGPDPS